MKFFKRLFTKRRRCVHDFLPHYVYKEKTWYDRCLKCGVMRPKPIR